jgi:hypothetical protein
LRAPQLVKTAANNTAIAIRFATFFMIDSDYKINPFPSNFVQWVDEVYKNRDNFSVLSAKNRNLWGEWSGFMAQLSDNLGKFSKKAPKHFEAGCICDSRSLEQSTSEAVAQWKSDHFKSKTLLSLTGGLGVDDWAWAKTGTKITSLDPNKFLNNMVRFNVEKLGINLERLTMTAEAYLSNLPENKAMHPYDLIYVDPDRRVAGKRANQDVSEYAPDIFNLIQRYPNIGKSWLLKISPMVDPTWIRSQFQCRADIYAVGLQGETKEILVHAFPQEPTSSGKTEVVCLLFEPGSTVSFTANYFYRTHSDSFPTSSAETGQYIFEPAAPIFAAHLHTQIPQRFGVCAATPNHNFFVAQAPIAAAFGRSLLVEHTLQGSLREIQRQLKSLLLESYNKKILPQLNITARNCGITNDAIKKTLLVRDGGPNYLFITKHETRFMAWLGKIVR